jgi:hypothetical protein
MIDEIAVLVEERFALYKQGEDEQGASVYFFITSAHRATYLKPVSGRMGLEPSEHAKKLQQIALRGPEVGVHLVFTCDNTKTFEGIFTRQNLNQFDRRVALRMNKEESQFLLGESHADSLRSYRAFLLDDEASTPLEKFKPYGLPTDRSEREALFKFYAERIKAR